jgi:hypothetical protein
MTTKQCAHCGRSFQAGRSTAKFCSNAHRQAHFKRERDPLVGSDARAARKAAWLDKQQYGQTKKWTTIELAKRGLGFDGADKSPGDADQDPKRPYDIRWIRRFARQQKRSGEWTGRKMSAYDRLLRLEAGRKGPWEDRTVLFNPYEDSVHMYLRGLEAAGESLYPELEVALWHLHMNDRPRGNLVGFFEGNVPLVEAVQTMRKLDDTLSLALGANPRDAKGWLEYKLPIIKSYQDWSEMSASAATAIMERLDRIERLESMRAETMDRVRETVDRIAARYPDDERIDAAIHRLLDEESA